MKVTLALVVGESRLLPSTRTRDSSDKKLLDAIENASANTFAKPSISITLTGKFAPADPAIIAKVVIVPSIDP